MSTFRPTFKTRTKGPDTQKEGDKEKKKSKDKDRKRGKAILSFEEEGDGLSLPDKPKTKRKKVKKEKEVIPLSATEEEEMWVEKAPEVHGTVKATTVKADVNDESVQQATVTASGRRMRAVDFL
jgi:hypothetical protein